MKVDHRKGHIAIGDLHLHVHRARLDAFERNRRDPDDHGKAPVFQLGASLTRVVD